MSDGIEAFRERLEGRLAIVDMTLRSGEADRFERYYRLLARWNATINLTSLVLDDSPASTLDRLFVEPLLAAEYVPETPLTWLDLGSGGGSPAIPLKIVRPAASLTMVESSGRKGAFLREACRAVELQGVVITTARIEDLPALLPPGCADLLTIRAVRLNPKIRSSAGYLLKRGGRMLHFASNVDTLPAGFHALARRELTLPGDCLMVFERR